MINNYPDTLFSTEIIELLGKLSDKKDLKSNIALLKMQIAKCESFEKEESISQLLALMEENNCSDEEIIKNLEDYKSYYHTIKLLVPYYLKNNEEDKAIELLESYIEVENKKDNDVSDALVKLKNLYYKDGNMTSYTSLLLKLVYEYGYYNEDDFDILKRENPDWNEIKEEIIQTYEIINYEKLYQFYIYNDMFTELESDIFKYGDINDVNEYKDILIKKSPIKLMEYYEEMIYKLLKVAKRSKYKKVAKILKAMEEIPNSKENIERIKKELKEKYPKRNALFYEIRRIS